MNEALNFSLASSNSYEKDIEDIIERLECLIEEKDVLRLQVGICFRWSPKTPTTSLVEESEAYGRDGDREAIVELLLSGNSSDEKIRVIPIVGMGGVGKSTLAQLVYNDERVKTVFELKAWVCVSEEFDVVRVTKLILEAIGLGGHGTNDLNSLQLKLKEMLYGRKFLIVLDDVWNENYDEWCHLKRPFQYGAQASRIVVTTRSQRVASIMQTVESYKLKYLSDEDCWNLFAKHAYGYKNSSTNPSIDKIGRKIVKKCKGLPLAAKTLGGLLRSTSDCKEWENISRSDIWDLTETESNILPALLLSYHYLPSHLKRCFAYCSIFSKGYKFEKEELILLWMAENLLQIPLKGERIEDIGDKYFLELVSRSFFQQSGSAGQHFVMHDLVNDLAHFVSGRFCVRLEDDNSDINVDRRMRYLSFHAAHGFVNFEAIDRNNRLRTLLTQGNAFHDHKLQDDTISKLICLRVLSFSFLSILEELPESIGLLRHLRYLKVSGTRIKRFPDSICSLYNLQTLKATWCINLAELPQDMHNLVNLRHLHIGYTQIKEMPPHMSKLRSLQHLSHFIVGKDYGCSVGELGQLPNIRGSFSIKNLKHVVHPKEAMEARLCDKKYLTQLDLNWGHDTDTDDSQHEKYVLDHLQPHAGNLNELSIRNYTGTEFPNWLGDFAFCNLSSVSLENCKYCYVLPPLGNLPCLKRLEISNFKMLQSVGREFYGKFSCGVNAIQSFASLEVLKFYHMQAWERWSHPDDKASCIAFPCLRQVVICDCPRLIGDLPKALPCLTQLKIQDSGKFFSSLPCTQVINELLILGCSNPEFPVLVGVNQCYQLLELLEIRCCHSLKSFPLDLFPNLKSLRISYCENLESLAISAEDGQGNLEERPQNLIALQSLSIYGCPNLLSFPSGGLPAPNLTSLSIEFCPKLKSLPERMHCLLPSLEALTIWDCPDMNLCPDGGLPSSLKSLEFSDSDNLVANGMNLHRQSPSGLTLFTIHTAFQDAESYPPEGVLPGTLTGLNISNSPRLKTLNTKGLEHLNSLRQLDIYRCPKLDQ
ncbi:putative disease resistance protein At3g14460 [Prosopis cineraria]|uniref:putative disease resistance protein At3g14460 n=1 Tax=Prosopis cineraria TaxID=364024 RepID=UPI00241042B2|nr:putative disease resistance protein At3g14460 [Prosopis cineraria]